MTLPLGECSHISLTSDLRMYKVDLLAFAYFPDVVGATYPHQREHYDAG